MFENKEGYIFYLRNLALYILLSNATSRAKGEWPMCKLLVVFILASGIEPSLGNEAVWVGEVVRAVMRAPTAD